MTTALETIQAQQLAELRERIEDLEELVRGLRLRQATATSPLVKQRIRVEITQNTRGYQYETSAEAEWTGPIAVGRETVEQLVRGADSLARAEIAIRKELDGDTDGAKTAGRTR